MRTFSNDQRRKSPKDERRGGKQEPILELDFLYSGSVLKMGRHVDFRLPHSNPGSVPASLHNCAGESSIGGRKEMAGLGCYMGKVSRKTEEERASLSCEDF